MNQDTDWVVDCHWKSTDQYEAEVSRSAQHDFAFAAFKYAVKNYPHMHFRLRQGNTIALNSALGHGR